MRVLDILKMFGLRVFRYEANNGDVEKPVTGWLFFRHRGGSLSINSDMLGVSASAARTALKNSQLIPRPRDESYVISRTGH